MFPSSCFLLYLHYFVWPLFPPFCFDIFTIIYILLFLSCYCFTQILFLIALFANLHTFNAFHISYFLVKVIWYNTTFSYPLFRPLIFTYVIVHSYYCCLIPVSSRIFTIYIHTTNNGAPSEFVQNCEHCTWVNMSATIELVFFF